MLPETKWDLRAGMSQSKNVTRPRVRITSQSVPVFREPKAAVRRLRIGIVPTYLIQGRYTRTAIKGMIANPEDRAVEVEKLIEAAGGKLVAHYVTLGEYDFAVIAEAPDEKAVSAAVLVAAAGGGVTDMRTTVAMTSAEAKDVFTSAGNMRISFRSAGT